MSQFSELQQRCSFFWHFADNSWKRDSVSVFQAVQKSATFLFWIFACTERGGSGDCTHCVHSRLSDDQTQIGLQVCKPLVHPGL